MRMKTQPTDCGAVLRKITTENPSFHFEVAHVNAPVKEMPLFHWHDYLEITYVDKGRGLYSVEGKTVPVEAGDLVVINHNERHKVSPQGQLFETVLHFGRELISYYSMDNLFDYETTVFANKLTLTPSGYNLVKQCLRNIIDEYNAKRPHYDLYIIGELYKIIGETLRQGNMHKVPLVQTRSKSYEIMRLDEIKLYIAAHIKEELSLTTVAKHFFLSNTYFSEYFKSSIGMGFAQYKNMLKVNGVMDLMADNGGCSVLEAALECGFNSESQFYEVFRKVTGQTPKQYFACQV